MSSDLSTRLSDLGSTLALVLVGLLVAFLLYAFLAQRFGGQSEPVRADNPADLVGEIIQVEVRNGGGVDGAAAEMTSYLRRQGFDVVEVGDHSSYDQEETTVIDRVGDLESAQRVGRALGLSEDRITQEIQRELYLDASIIIGRDFDSLEPFQNN